MSPRTRHARAALIFLAGAAPFLLLLGSQDVANTHEARVAQTARETAATGWPWRGRLVEVPSARLVSEGGRKFLRADPAAPPLRVNPWVVPVLTGEIRLQKPPLPYWCAAVLFRLFGESEWAARFVPALLGALATPVVYDLARRLIGRRAAAPAALAWVSGAFVVSEFRKTMADPYLAFFTLACVWAWVRASEARLRGPPGASAGWLVAFYASLGLAMLAKGPVVLVHVPIALLAYHACYRRPLPASPLGHAAGVALLLAVALPWPLAVWRSVPHALELWRYESVGELADNRRNAAPFWVYLPKLPYLALPWTPLWAAALANTIARWRRSADRRALFPLAWYGLTVIFFSFVNLKKDAYLLPVMPAQALLLAQFARDTLAWARKRHWPRWFDSLTWVQTALGAGAAVTVVVLLLVQTRQATPEVRRLPFAAIAAIVALAASAAAPPVWTRVRASRAPVASWFAKWFVAEAVSCAAAVVAFVAVYNTVKENRRSPRPFAGAVWRHVSEGGAGPHAAAAGRALYRAGLPPTVAFYLPLDTGREDTARTIVVVAGKNGRAPDVAATYTAETGRPVAEARPVPLPENSSPDRWTVFELTLANPRRYAAGE